MDDLNLEPLAADLNKVILRHLKSIEENLKEKNKINESTINILNNLPFVKELRRKLKNAENTVEELTKKLSQVNFSTSSRINLEISEIEVSGPGPTHKDIEESVQSEVEKSEQKKYEKIMQHMPRYSFDSAPNSEDESDNEINTNNVDLKYTRALEKLMAQQSHFESVDDEITTANSDDDDDDDESTLDSEDDIESEDEDEDGADADDEAELEEDKEENGEAECEAAQEEVAQEEAAQDADVVEKVQEDVKEAEADVEEKVQEDVKEAESDVEEEEDDELEVDEIVINDTIYYTDDKQNGLLFACLESGQVGEEVGHLENGNVFFS